MTSAPHSSVLTNSTTHELVNQSSYLDDTIMSSNTICAASSANMSHMKYFGGHTKKSAAKRHPRTPPPGYVKPPRMSANSLSS